MRVLRRLLLLFLVLLVAVGLALWYLPAGFAWRHFGDRFGHVVGLQDVGGTVRSGHAGQLLVNGFPLGRLEWTLDWRSLLARQPAGQWRLASEAWQAQAAQTRWVDGAVEITDLRATLPALLLQPVLDIPALNFLGSVDLEIAQLRQRDGLIESASGSARWREAGVTGQAQARFGPIRATFATQAPGHIVGEVAQEDGPLIVDGQFELIGSRYRAEAIVRARDPADPSAQVLHFVGQALPDGSSLLVVEGELNRPAAPPPAP